MKDYNPQIGEKEMQFIKKHPSLFGWLPFYILTQLLASRAAQSVASSLSKYDTGPFNILTVSIAFVAYLLFNFVLFLVSIRLAVLPVYQFGRIRAVEPTEVSFARLARKWFDYLWEFLIFCFPLACVRFSNFEVQVGISMAWQLVASYIAFRLAIDRWLNEITGHTLQNDDKETAPA